MLVDQLLRIPEFHHLTPSELRGLAARSHVLCVPEERWLVQQNRDISAYCYLLKGQVRTQTPSARISAKAKGELKYFYPGCGAAQSLSTVHILRIDAAQFDFLASAPTGPTGVVAIQAGDWLKSFLSSHIMRQLPESHWRALLSSFQRTTVLEGDTILEKGDSARVCYVVESGHAVIHRDAKTLAYIGPGDLFGEDALVLRQQRNATVTALEDMRVHSIEQAVFVEALLKNMVRFVAPASVQGVSLNLDQYREDERALFVANLRQQSGQWQYQQDYFVFGGSRAERSLCTFLLVQQGVRAFAVEDV